MILTGTSPGRCHSRGGAALSRGALRRLLHERESTDRTLAFKINK